MHRVAIILALVTLMAGCGFHLRGSRPLPPALQAIRVRIDQPYRVGSPPLVDALQDRLRDRGALAEGGDAAVLRILDLRLQKRVLSVSPVDGRAVEYELTTAADFNLRKNGKELVPRQTLSVQKAYSFDNTERLASEGEEDDLLASMQADLADLILLRIETALRAGASGQGGG